MLTNTEYKNTPDQWVEGQAVGDRKTRPRQLEQLPQIQTLTVTAGDETDDLVITVVDDETGQSYSATATGDANEATLGANALAAVRASEIDKVYSVVATTAVSGSDLVLTFTARHGNRSYTLSATGGTAVTAPVAAETQAPGGAGLAFGRMVVRGTSDGSFAAPSATSLAGDAIGFLWRSDANHFHSLENDTPTAVDLSEVGVHYGIIYDGRMAVRPEDAVAPGDPVFMRRAGTGRLGGFRATPAGAAEVWTVTPTAAETSYALEVRYGGQTYVAIADGADGTYSATEICDDLRASLGTIAGLTFGGTATLTITTDAGTALDADPRDIGNGTLGIAETTAADVDAIDVSAFCEWESSAAADGYALLRINL